MSSEVKMIYADIEAQLSEVESQAVALNPQAESPITGNTMDVVTKLTELSTKLETLLTSYQKVLLENISTTENSVQFMRETDETISKAIDTTSKVPMVMEK